MNTGYSVRQIPWSEPQLQRLYSNRGGGHGRPGGVPVVLGTEPDYAVAWALAEEFDCDVWRKPGFNPFHYGGSLAWVTSLPEPQFRDWLLDRGMEPPEEGVAWAAWFDALRVSALGLREALDKLRFFDVVERKEPLYAVVEHLWEFCDNNTFDCDEDGGAFVQAYRSRAKANAECTRLNTLARVEAAARWDGCYFERERRDDGKPAAAADFFRVIELDGELGAES